ncbi:hypothetical protein LAZ40_11845 [Cereibacter sphaeroides]|uniref:hypothetical protein n=1 Tax=Cereibacter sphaeroides TaxID=1063 RepID=UPI001F286E3B|nr:hypothetical protein [Cereibacter sphaeroides]MCE6959712.1 hypothetical protein [Cereibacter sphaeroides]MCE6974427.1 hypothetical protein [Cereibacter sphaeroides]
MRWRTIVGIVLCMSALGQAGLAGFIVQQTRSGEVRAAEAWTKADGLCLEAVKSTQATVEEKGLALEVTRTVKTEEDWRVVLMDASSAISYCSTRQMVRFCMGKACGTERAATDLSTSLKNQSVTPSIKEILEAQPIRISYTLIGNVK